MKPKILVLTDEGISQAHGTGTVLMRHFEAYPQERICNVFPMKNGKPYLKKSLHAKAGFFSYHITVGLSEIGMHQTLLHNYFENYWFVGLKKSLSEINFYPDVIYSTASTGRGIMLLLELIKLFPKVPIIQHFMDYLPFGLKEVTLNLKRTAPSLDKVWSLTKNFSKKYDPILGVQSKLVRVFHRNLPQKFKTDHKEYSPNFKAIMIGNCWMPELLNDLKKTWNWLSTKLEGLGAIEWYVHPDTIKWINEKGIALGDEIKDMGYFTKEEFWKRLREADMAIIPFNGQEIPENGYAR